MSLLNSFKLEIDSLMFKLPTTSNWPAFVVISSILWSIEANVGDARKWQQLAEPHQPRSLIHKTFNWVVLHASSTDSITISGDSCLITTMFLVQSQCYVKWILKEFRNGLENPELLKWPVKGNDPCGPPAWPYVFCSGGRVTQIQAKGLGLKGTLPQDFNQLDKLQNIGLQKNNLYGKLPSFSGLSNLKFAYLDGNEFDTIPADFFHGLSNVRVLALDKNPFNKTAGWSIPSELQESTRLTNFSCSSCNIAGPLPGFFGKMPSLTALKLSYNRIEGEIPDTFRDSLLQVLWLNNQEGASMTGPIDVIGSMVGLTSVWLHGNAFTGQIPDNIGDLTSLKDLNLNGNELVGLIPKGLADLNLHSLDLNNNQLMGAIPKFKAADVTYSSNSFCQSSPGEPCAPEVDALLEFLKDLNYPHHLANEWTGNDPCKGPWFGITCIPSGHVSIINLQKLNLNGTLSPSLAALDSLMEIHLAGNNLHGRVPTDLTKLRNLRLLDISGNNFDQPLPKFRNGVRILTNGNPGLDDSKSKSPHRPTIDSPPTPKGSNPVPSPGNQPPSFSSPPSPGSRSDLASKSPSLAQDRKKRQSSLKSVVIITVAISATSAILFLGIALFCCLRKRKKSKKISGGTVVHPKGPSNQEFKTKTSENPSLGILGSHAASENSGGLEAAHMVKGGYLIIPVERTKVHIKLFALIYVLFSVTGKVTTKVDVFSFGVVLMELLTGLTALDEHRSEESRVLFEWFWAMKFNKENIIATIDPSMNAKEDIYDSICTVSELARHCTARDPNHRPDMGHVVNVLSQLVHKWKPVEDEEQQQTQVLADIDYTVPLPQMLMAWQNEKTGDFSGISQDSKGSTHSKASVLANASVDPR
nr:receptor-like kinase TMK3 [Ipomoea batatas]